jgi:hypothetical protein
LHLPLGTYIILLVVVSELWAVWILVLLLEAISLLLQTSSTGMRIVVMVGPQIPPVIIFFEELNLV